MIGYLKLHSLRFLFFLNQNLLVWLFCPFEIFQNFNWNFFLLKFKTFPIFFLIENSVHEHIRILGFTCCSSPLRHSHFLAFLYWFGPKLLHQIYKRYFSDWRVIKVVPFGTAKIFDVCEVMPAHRPSIVNHHCE